MPSKLKNKILILALAVCFLHACVKKEPEKTHRPDFPQRKQYSINLFSEGNSLYDNSGKLSFDQAFRASNKVLLATYIEKTDSSDTRGVRMFYLYKIMEGDFEKSKKPKKKAFPLFFLSEQNLFRGKVLKDSIYVFLIPLKQYGLLQKKMAIKYKWMENAPLISKK